MVRMVAIAALIVSVGASVSVPARAQGAGIEVGTHVPFASTDGTQAGVITIRDITDPFTDYRPGSPPPDGRRYVQVLATFEAAADKPFDAQPSQLVLQDTEGFVWDTVTVDRPPGATPRDLEDQVLGPGDRISGAVGFEISQEAVVDEVLYRQTPESNDDVLYLPLTGRRLVTLVDLAPNDGPPVGAQVEVADPDGGQAGRISVTDVQDPFTGYDVDSPPTADQRYVEVAVTFEAANDKPFSVDPASIVLLDSNGVQTGYGLVNHPASAVVRELKAQPLEPLDRVSGVIDYVVPKPAVLTKVIYEPPSGGRRLIVADLAGAGPVHAGGAPTSSPGVDVPSASPR